MDTEYPVIAPSILAADFSRLGEQIRECLDTGIKWIHCDIMDGHFVPNISYGPGVVSTVREIAPEAFLDVHLMIENPDQYIEDFADAGADLISVHYEACPHLHRTLQNIRANGCMTGVVVNPATSVDLLLPVLPEVDLVLVMSVNPGFGGQKFIESSYQKIDTLYRYREQHGFGYLIEVDGGVGLENSSQLTQTGADILVAGSSIFKSESMAVQIRKIRESARDGHAARA
ncbi:MAG: ribulose-phosphate 3-epimerase [Balneolaceae bacterium]|nr:MAG: ribulose-phosphate 3-epimerase [Balneolaceae bacterium]